MTDHSNREVLNRLYNLRYAFFRLTIKPMQAKAWSYLYDMRRDNLGDKALLDAIASLDSDTTTNLTLSAIKISDDDRISEITLATFDIRKFHYINNNLITIEDLLENLAKSTAN